MPESTRTPNPATTTRPERSSKKVAHKKPLAWLPLALLALLALLAVLIFLIVRGANSNDNNNAAAARTIAPSAAAQTPGSGTGTGGAGGFVAGPGALPGALIGGAGLAPIPATNVGTAAAGVAAGGSAAAGSEAATAAANSASGTAGTVLFTTADASPDAAGQQVIEAAATQLKTSGAKTVEVRGYTDVVAGAATNDPLSQKRADNVAAALRALLPGVSVTSVAKGQGDPVASNDTAAGRQQNRRVVISATG